MTWQTDDAERAALIAELKVGDKVLIELPVSWSVAASEHIVTRITPTQIICGLHRYHKDGGYAVASGSRYKRDRIAAPSLVPRLRQAQNILDVERAINVAERDCRRRDWPCLLAALQGTVAKVEALIAEGDAP